MKEVKRFNFSKPPIKPIAPLKLVGWVLYMPVMWKHKLKIDKINMEGLKPPYILLCNHQSFYDIKMLPSAIFPHHANYIAAIDALKQHGSLLLRMVGCIGKRKFLPMDMALIRNVKYAIEKNRQICVLYPEARFTLDGSRSYIPSSVAKMCKMMKVPIVTLNMRGCYVANPQFSQKFYGHVPLEATMTQIVTQEEIGKLSSDEINSRIISALEYDEYNYQKEKNILIKDKNRAKGLESLLYQCPHCYTEFEMETEGSSLRCRHCGKVWEYTELGEMRALDGDTEFSHIPDWFKWQRQMIAAEVRAGKYYFEDDVEVWTLPDSTKWYKHGMGKFVHDLNGYRLTCKAYGKDTFVKWDANETYGCHIEYNFRKKADVLDISKVDESYWLYPVKKNVITKISIATEEIYKLHSDLLI